LTYQLPNLHHRLQSKHPFTSPQVGRPVRGHNTGDSGNMWQFCRGWVENLSRTTLVALAIIKFAPSVILIEISTNYSKVTKHCFAIFEGGIMDTSPTFKIIRNTCLSLILLLSTLINPHNADAGRTVRVGVYEAKPLAYSDKDGSAHGFFVDMLNHIAGKEQWNVQYVPGSWQEGLDRLKSDNIDLVLCIGYTAERDKYMDFPKEYLLLNWGVLYRPKGSQITSLLELEGKSVSALKGDVYLTGFLELVRQFNVHVRIQEVDKYSKVFKAVESGAVAAGVAGNLYGILNEDGRRAEQTPVIFAPIKVGYAVNEGKNGDLIAALDRHIAAMKADKTSIYHHELEHLLGKKDTKIPKEAYWALTGVAAALLLATTFIVLLRRQVKGKTEHLEKRLLIASKQKMIYVSSKNL